MNTHDITVWVCSILQCTEVHYHTCTCSTHFGNTVGISDLWQTLRRRRGSGQLCCCLHLSVLIAHLPVLIPICPYLLSTYYTCYSPVHAHCPSAHACYLPAYACCSPAHTHCLSAQAYCYLHPHLLYTCACYGLGPCFLLLTARIGRERRREGRR